MISRKRFIAIGASFMALIAAMKLIPFQSKVKSKKYLTQDGKLVEVNTNNITLSRKAFTSEIRNWVSTKND